MKRAGFVLLISWMIVPFLTMGKAFAASELGFFPSFHNTNGTNENFSPDLLSSSTSTPQFTIQGTVISGPPNDAVPVASSTVAVFQAAIGGFPVFKVWSVPTKPDGSFSIGFANTPVPGAILYLRATGGDVGGASNPSINLMSVLGVAPFSGNSITATVNERTTVAAAYVLSSFIVRQVPCMEQNIPGVWTAAVCGYGVTDNSASFLTTAIKTLPSLVNSQTGALGSVINNNSNNPRRLNALSNALANCVRSPAACANLFNAANSPSSPGHTLSAIININKSPAHQVGSVFGAGQGGPYAVTLTSAPTDWTLTLFFLAEPQNVIRYGIAIDKNGHVVGNGNFGTIGGVAFDISNNVWKATDRTVTENNIPILGGGGIQSPFALAFDLEGNLWIANREPIRVTEGENVVPFLVVSELDSSGSPVSPSGYFLRFSPFGSPGSANLYSVAVDETGDVWVAGSGSVFELAGSNSPSPGKVISPSIGYTAGGITSEEVEGVRGIAIDGIGDVWVTNSSASSVTELDGLTGNPISPTGYMDVGGLNGPQGIAIDGASNVWVTNFSGNSITELVGGNSPPHTGSPISPSLTGYTGEGMSGPYGIAIDSGGDVWVSNTAPLSPASFTEFVGAAIPVITPIVRCLRFEKNHRGQPCKP